MHSAAATFVTDDGEAVDAVAPACVVTGAALLADEPPPHPATVANTAIAAPKRTNGTLVVRTRRSNGSAIIATREEERFRSGGPDHAIGTGSNERP